MFSSLNKTSAPSDREIEMSKQIFNLTKVIKDSNKRIDKLEQLLIKLEHTMDSLTKEKNEYRKNRMFSVSMQKSKSEN